MTRLVIAVDGPAASGKGAIAYGLAQSAQRGWQ
jgi:cytidylate kinase